MTVLQENPVTVLLTLNDILSSIFALPGAQRHNLELVCAMLTGSIVTNLLHWVDSLTQHENDWIVRSRGIEKILD